MNRLPLPGFAVAAITLVIDQLVKWWVAGPLALQDRVMIELLPVFRLTWAENRGISLGLLTADSETERGGLVAMTALIAIGVIVWMFKEKARADVMALGLVLGGALGNIIDRTRFGYVVDFLDFEFNGYHWPAFNVADSAICIAAGLLFLSAFQKETAAPAQR